ncbi:hypothetical protein CATRI_05775 [Corynebacterium atrinae]|uniref:hypothetical protein n=1 Tax=Corynebacterium atrinae TaxID=1336740 RepID=UPI0025B3C3DE|nr:hypothetical protein [Corynebacterium atrinae]WJY63244.1 hypothetical protein CATRI_05775 [Corynebacterium atrinae]
MNYHNDLAYHLRRRGCGDDQVAEVLHTVDDAISSTGRTAEEEFGKPQDYAGEFEGPNKGTPGRKILGVCGFLGILCVGVYAVWPQWFGFTTPIVEQFAGMMALLVFLAIGILIGSIVDHRLPSSYTEHQQLPRR